MNVKEFLEFQNPHWFGETDALIENFENMKYRKVPSWISHVSLKPFSLNFVIGPRRVGKSTGLKLLIQQMIQRGISPENIVYLDVDLIPTIEFFQEVLASIKTYKFIFIDEVSSLEEWWRPLKGFVDVGYFKRNVITVSGSSTLKIKRQAELFPGRLGKGALVEVLPMSFPEYVSLFSSRPKTRELKKYFEKYLHTGGFFGSINLGEEFIKEMIFAFESDVLKSELNTKTAFKILSSVLSKVPSSFSYNSVAHDIGVDYKTVRNYLESFENMYIINTIFFRHDDRIDYKKEKKICFRDPFFLRAFSIWTGTEVVESAVYEHIVQEHLFRKFGEIYYYRNKYEIDCIAGDMKIEVKAGKPHRRYPRGVTVLGKEDIPEFLVSLFS